jgi:hypothetical protein
MTTVLLNSAMMPDEGIYILKRISRDDFGRLVADAYQRGDLHSYVGYPETAQHIERVSGVPIQVNRAPTKLAADQATILICKLAYRVADPGMKGKLQPTEDDYEYYVATYTRY